MLGGGAPHGDLVRKGIPAAKLIVVLVILVVVLAITVERRGRRTAAGRTIRNTQHVIHTVYWQSISITDHIAARLASLCSPAAAAAMGTLIPIVQAPHGALDRGCLVAAPLRHLLDALPQVEPAALACPWIKYCQAETP